MIDQTTSGIETTFYFIQKTWYKPLEDLAPTLRNYDVIVANSAWWDIQRGGGEDKCIAKGMYENADCLATYEAQLTEMSSNILQAFGSNKKAAMFRTSNCCGGTSSGAEIVTKIRRSPFAIAVDASTVARRAKRRTGPRGTSFGVPRGRTRAPSHLMRSLPQFWTARTASTAWTTYSLSM